MIINIFFLNDYLTMFHLDSFISEYVTGRQVSMFAQDIDDNRCQLTEEIQGRSVLVIGGAGSIGSSFIKSVLQFKPSKLVVIDHNENGLAELTRDLRSSNQIEVPPIYLTYPLHFADPIFQRIFKEHNGFDIVANFSAHKHVRSEKDRHSVQALIENNCLKARQLLETLSEIPPKHFFCVSTDKAANPVNVMGASKKVMEDLIMTFSDCFPVTTARFANVAFSNGSLPASWMERVMKKQPLVAPTDVRRYFVSPQESGQICMLAAVLGKSGEIFFPKLGQHQMRTFSQICDDFIRAWGYEPLVMTNEDEARDFAAAMDENGRSYPVVHTCSDTTGEKSFEEFVVAGEITDMNRFHGLGVIERKETFQSERLDLLFTYLKHIFSREDFTKEDVVGALKDYLPNFVHEEKGRNLDSKM